MAFLTVCFQLPDQSAHVLWQGRLDRDRTPGPILETNGKGMEGEPLHQRFLNAFFPEIEMTLDGRQVKRLPSINRVARDGSSLRRQVDANLVHATRSEEHTSELQSRE